MITEVQETCVTSNEGGIPETLSKKKKEITRRRTKSDRPKNVSKKRGEFVIE